MIVVRMGQQDEVDAGQIPDPHPGALDAFEQEQPVGKVRVHQNIQVVELDEKRCVTDPGDGNLAMPEPGKHRAAGSPRARRQPSLPDEFLKKRARIEMFGRRQILERPRDSPARRYRPMLGTMGHTTGEY